MSNQNNKSDTFELALLDVVGNLVANHIFHDMINEDEHRAYLYAQLASINTKLDSIIERLDNDNREDGVNKLPKA